MKLEYQTTNSLPLLFQKNIAFTKILKSGGRPHEFNFRRKKVLGNYEYNIDSSDDRGERYYFTCYKNDNGRWTIREEILPAWILEVLSAIPAILEESEQENAITHK